MNRYLQLTICEPLTPIPIEEIESAIMVVDLETGKVTLPGGFVCSLDSLSHTVHEMEVAQRKWPLEHYSYRSGWA